MNKIFKKVISLALIGTLCIGASTTTFASELSPEANNAGMKPCFRSSGPIFQSDDRKQGSRSAPRSQSFQWTKHWWLGSGLSLKDDVVHGVRVLG